MISEQHLLRHILQSAIEKNEFIGEVGQALERIADIVVADTRAVGIDVDADTEPLLRKTTSVGPPAVPEQLYPPKSRLWGFL